MKKPETHPPGLEHLQPFFGAIAECLESRSPDAFKADPTHKVPVFVARMCERLAAMCTEYGVAPISVKDVLLQESMASGHSDYHRKFALYCRELAKYGPSARPGAHS